MDNWNEVLKDKFVVDSLMSRMENAIIISIGQNVLKDLEKTEKLELYSHVTNSSFILNAVNAAVIRKINKLMTKQKRKHNEENIPKCLSCKILSKLPDDFLFCDVNFQDLILEMKNLHTIKNGLKENNFEWKLNEDKICKLLNIAKSFPIVFSTVIIQKIFLIYFISLHKDLSIEFGRGNLTKLQREIEGFVIGK